MKLPILKHFSPARNRRSQAALSLVEVLISSTVGVVVLGGLLTLVTVVAKEQRREMVNSNLQQEANLLEDKITRLIREMSGTQAAILGDPIATASPFFRSVVVSRAASPWPREKLAFNPQTFACTYTPDGTSPSSTIPYFTSSSLAVLRNLYFFPSTRTDGAPDSSALTIYFQLDDNGMAQRGKTNSFTRSFTATMRNN